MTVADARIIRPPDTLFNSERRYRRLNGKAAAVWQFLGAVYGEADVVAVETRPFLVRVDWIFVPHDIDWFLARHNLPSPTSFKVDAFVSWAEPWCRAPEACQERITGEGCRIEQLLSCRRNGPGPISFFVLEHLCSRPTSTPGGSSAAT